ncbi:hypothetical protein EON82_24180, partial [bacterium]
MIASARGMLKALNLEVMKGPATYNRDGLLSRHNSDFQQEPRFAQAYASGAASGAWQGEQVQWRAHVVAWAAQNGLHLDGDFVECGVDRGGMASVIFEYTRFAEQN